MSIHRSKPRPSIASQLISASLGDDAASPSEKEGEPKEKKKCDICKKDLAVSSVSRHMKDKHGGLYKCTICGKNYKTTTALESHQEKAHVVKTISNFECDFCNYKTMNKYYLNDHMKRQHAGAGSNSFVCSKCFARKQNQYLLHKHMQQHVESFCSVCEKKFNSKKNLKRHQSVHEIQRCQQCGRNFNSKKDSRLHKIVHKKEKIRRNEEGEPQVGSLEGVEFVNLEDLDLDTVDIGDIGNDTLALLDTI